MKSNRIFPILAMTLALAACGTDTYESVSEDLDKLQAKEISLTAEDSAGVTALRATAEELHRDGKSEDAVQALKEARRIIESAQDADLLRKSEG